LKGKGLLLLGVGFGPELQYWVKLKPGFIAGTEVLNYASAWEVVKQHYKPTPIGFFRTTGSDLACFDAESFDCVASTAVLEHVQDVPGLMQESWRVLRPGGVAAFSFGPLYHTFGGDHFSGNDDFRNGFNHVLLDENEYHEYLESIPMREEGLADGRVWIKQRFFSYLHADEYLNIFKQNFEILFVRVHLSIKAMRFQATYPGRFRELLLKTEMHEKEPLIGAMDVFLKKSCDPSEPGSPID
jgi:SAM-dependent methyltransferase